MQQIGFWIKATTSVVGTIEDIVDGVVLESDVSAIEVNGLGADVDTTLGEVAHWRPHTHHL